MDRGWKRRRYYTGCCTWTPEGTVYVRGGEKEDRFLVLVLFLDPPVFLCLSFFPFLSARCLGSKKRSDESIGGGKNNKTPRSPLHISLAYVRRSLVFLPSSAWTVVERSWERGSLETE